MIDDARQQLGQMLRRHIGVDAKFLRESTNLIGRKHLLQFAGRDGRIRALSDPTISQVPQAGRLELLDESRHAPDFRAVNEPDHAREQIVLILGAAEFCQQRTASSEKNPMANSFVR